MHEPFKKSPILLVVVMFLTCSGAFSQSREFVSSKGQELVTPEGEPLLLRGINLGNWLVPEGYMFKFDSATSPRMIEEVLCQLVGADEAREFWRRYRDTYITREDIRFIRSLGLNSIRVPFNWRLFIVEDRPDEWSGPGFDMLDRVVRWCSEEGLWIVLDMHCAPGGQTGDNIDDSWGHLFLFESPEAQERTVRLWRKIAERYASERFVVGYDLLNEPIPHFYDQAKYNLLLEPLYKRIVGAIREVDSNHLVFLGGAQWDTNFRVFGPPFDSQVVYTFHKYWCDTTQEMIQEYVDYRSKYNIPVWLGESGENSNQWIDSFRRLLERNNIGWCFWPYKKMDAATCMVTFRRPDHWDAIRKFANSPRTSYASIRAERPDIAAVREALEQFLEFSQFRNCQSNPGYLKSLGIVSPR